MKTETVIVDWSQHDRFDTDNYTAVIVTSADSRWGAITTTATGVWLKIVKGLVQIIECEDDFVDDDKIASALQQAHEDYETWLASVEAANAARSEQMRGTANAARPGYAGHPLRIRASNEAVWHEIASMSAEQRGAACEAWLRKSSKSRS